VVSTLAVAALIVVIVSTNSGGEDNGSGTARSSSSASPQAVAAAEAAGMNQEVRDGKFAFTVTAVNRTGSLGRYQARGEYVIVNLVVANTGKEPQSFFASNQKLIDNAGREFAPDDTAAMAINDNTSMVLDLNPGFSIKVAIPYDVPPGTTATAVELHDSMFSGGARVQLGNA
jgi:hypothetical protein